MKRWHYLLLAITVEVLAVIGIILALYGLCLTSAEAHTRRPLPRQVQVVRSYRPIVTMYNSTPQQTDGDPFTTASGTRVHFGTVAATCLEFGTKLRIPELYGTKVFTIEDTGAFGCDLIDVWIPLDGSVQWPGTARRTVQILK